MASATELATLEDVLAAVRASGGQVRKSASSTLVTCPVHDDRTPSLSVSEKNGELLLHCHGCKAPFTEILDAWELRAKSGNGKRRVRISKDPPPAGASWKTVATYQYLDETGALRYSIPRQELFGPDGSPILGPRGKPQKRFDATGISKGDRIPYHLDQIVEAKKASERVFFVEGEKCADLIIERIGAFATTLGSHGVFDPELHGKYFDGIAQLVIIPDESDESRKSFLAACQALADRIPDVRFVVLPELEDEQDIVEFFEGNDFDQQTAKLEELIENTSPIRPKFELVWSLAKEPDKDPVWLVENLIPANEETVCGYGRERTGKSLVMTEVCFALSTGTPAFGLDQLKVPNPVTCLYIAEEDPRVPTKRRLRWFLRGRGITEGIAPFRISIKKGWHFDRQRDQDEVIETTIRYGAKFVVLDPLIRLTHHVGKTGADFAPFADFLMRFTRETGATVASVHHDVKVTRLAPGEEIDHRNAISGGGIMAAHTAPIHIVRHGDAERLVVPVEFKFFEAPDPFAFKLVKPDLPDFHPDYWIRLEGEAKSEDESKKDAAEARLRDFLKKNPCATTKELREAKGAKGTDIDRAAKRLIKSLEILTHPGPNRSTRHRLAGDLCTCEVSTTL